MKFTVNGIEFDSEAGVFEPVLDLDPTERMKKFIKWCVDSMWEDGDLEIDTCDMQDELLRLGIIEPRPVDPDTNEYGCDYLYFLKNEYKTGKIDGR